MLGDLLNYSAHMDVLTRLIKLTLLFSILAVGAAADFTLPNGEPNVEAETYFRFAADGLRFMGVSASTSDGTNGERSGVQFSARAHARSQIQALIRLETVQTVTLLGMYCKFAEKTTASESTAWWDIAYVLAGSVSLIDNHGMFTYATVY